METCHYFKLLKMLIFRYKKTFIILIAFLIILIGGFFYFQDRIYFSHGRDKSERNFIIEKGEGNAEVATRLEGQGFVANKYYFIFYVKTNDLINKIMPGEYKLSGSLTIPEIAVLITSQEKKFVKITFPEGWNSQRMSERIAANGLDGAEFLKIAMEPGEIAEEFSFLQGEKKLEGYLFPDTYFFEKDATAGKIIRKMIENFDKKITPDLIEEMSGQKKSLREIIIMASIIEGEVRSEEDRKIVSGIFWKRIEIGQPLQSCATLAYILGENKKQYSFADTRTDSPYNTYLNKGLPPGSISNPGLSVIKAAIYPKESQYNYFLSDPETGKTVYSETIEEHNQNKTKYGL